MTEVKKTIRHLSFDQIKLVYDILYVLARKQGEPIPVFEEGLIDEGGLRSIVHNPGMHFFGVEMYKTLEEKAAILFYEILKNHVFVNGNKRMSIMCLESFLSINDHQLSATRSELREKALEVVQTNAQDHKNLKADLAIWIREHLEPFEV